MTFLLYLHFNIYIYRALWDVTSAGLAQVTSEAVIAQSQGQMQIDEDDASEKNVEVSMFETSQMSNNADKKYQQPSSVVVNKPADDGYNWRKYGQKQVKGVSFRGATTSVHI
ncbi:putative WRKY transcription factor [Arachis hypogaea]|nr:putative WRKY transcription factor [Arachis hypogaea]